MTGPIDRLLAAGWQLVHHADTPSPGGTLTSWIFLHPCGLWVSGSGPSYEIALSQAEAAANASDTSFTPEVGDVAKRWLNMALHAWKARLDWEEERDTHTPPRHDFLVDIWEDARRSVLEILEWEFLSDDGSVLSDEGFVPAGTNGKRRTVADVESIFRKAGFVSRDGRVLRGRALLDRFRSPGSSQDAEAVGNAFRSIVETVETASPASAAGLRELEPWIRDRSAEEWQDISTAPKFGSCQMSQVDVDLWHGERGRLTDCRWNVEGGYWSDWRGCNIGTDKDFTHWRRHPAPPKGTSP